MAYAKIRPIELDIKSRELYGKMKKYIEKGELCHVVNTFLLSMRTDALCGREEILDTLVNYREAFGDLADYLGEHPETTKDEIRLAFEEYQEKCLETTVGSSISFLQRMDEIAEIIKDGAEKRKSAEEEKYKIRMHQLGSDD